jgi:phosphoglycerate dehydrogenase-like enzyme
MSTTSRPVILIPGDDPPQIQSSPRLERLKEYGDVVLYDNRPQTEAELLDRTEDVTCVINSRGQVKWPGHVLKGLPNLKMITVCGIGTDAIDLEVAKEQGIVVSNIPGRTSPVVAEHAFALMLAVSRCTSFFTQKMKDGAWPLWLATSLSGKTLGVIGTGNIGCEMIRLSKAFGMNVIAWSFHPSEEKARRLGFQYVELDELLKQTDVVSLHVQLTDDSRNLIGERELSLMKPGSLLVNTARGAVVNSSALVNALNSGHLAGAGLDVFATEPLPADDPILNCDHVVLTPHCADQVPEGIDLLNSGCVENVIAFLEGRAQNVVNG